MKNLRDALADLSQTFQHHQFPQPRRQAEDFLSEILHCTRSQLYLELERKLTQQEVITLHRWLEQRLQGKPLAYLSGEVQFYGCTIEVNSSVLIPRLETEILVDIIAERLKKCHLQGKSLWDVCCGSGCIGLALKKAFPELSVTLSDCSAQAIETARRNGVKNNVEVNFLLGDLLAPFRGMKTDFLVCNPPYVSEREYAELDREVKDYEPRGALVAGERGLEFYERLAEELPAYLLPGGEVWFEIGFTQGIAVQNLFQRPPWKKSCFKNDWAGQNRFFFLEIE